MRYTDEGEPKKEKLLIFHGIILRSQLIVLLKNGIFFEETEGVRMRSWGIRMLPRSSGVGVVLTCMSVKVDVASSHVVYF